MTKARDLADFVSAGNPLADGTIDVADINGITATTAELNYTDGVTSNIQTQLNGKAPTASPTFTGTATYAALNDGTTTLTSTVAELNYVDGVTSNIQTQLDAKVDLTGDSMTGNLSFGDNDKAIFGAGSDLEIFHDSTNSVIKDVGTGHLYIAATDFLVTNSAINQNYITAVDNGAVNLYYAGATKLATTATGISVTGTALATTDTDTTNTGTVTLDFAANQNFVLTLTGNVTLANPTTEQVGQSGFIVFIQDATGGRTVSLGTDYETAGGAGLTLSSAANTTDVVPYIVAASGRILLGTPQLAFA